eukprot:scaffold8023_cov103-Isochrysis_galbana.AAC.9
MPLGTEGARAAGSGAAATPAGRRSRKTSVTSAVWWSISSATTCCPTVPTVKSTAAARHAADAAASSTYVSPAKRPAGGNAALPAASVRASPTRVPDDLCMTRSATPAGGGSSADQCAMFGWSQAAWARIGTPIRWIGSRSLLPPGAQVKRTVEPPTVAELDTTASYSSPTNSASAPATKTLPEASAMASATVAPVSVCRTWTEMPAGRGSASAHEPPLLSCARATVRGAVARRSASRAALPGVTVSVEPGWAAPSPTAGATPPVERVKGSDAGCTPPPSAIRSTYGSPTTSPPSAAMTALTSSTRTYPLLAAGRPAAPPGGSIWPAKTLAPEVAWCTS